MKVSQAIDILTKEYSGDEDICILWWDKPYQNPDDEDCLTDSSWAEVCTEFDEWEDGGNYISEWIADAVIEKTSNNKATYADQMGLCEEAVDNWTGR